MRGGWSEISITPNKPIKLAGQFYQRVSEYTETPVTVTALAIENSGEQAIFCSCDLVSVSSDLIERVRQIVAEKNKNIDTAKIIINATHTHTSVADRVLEYCVAAGAVKRLRHCKIGHMGYRDMQLYNTMFDGVSLKREIGPEIEFF